jgi:Fic family protein
LAHLSWLDAVRREGDWEGWTLFFLEGVRTIADEAVDAARDLFVRVTQDRARVLEVGSSSLTATRLFELLPMHPIVTVARVTRLLGTTKPTATKAINDLVAARS